MSENPLIAVVDDDASLRGALRNLLRSVGYRAAVFASAEEFLQASQLQATACVIVDVRMPGMSGLELQQHGQVNLAWRRFKLVSRCGTSAL